MHPNAVFLHVLINLAVQIQKTDFAGNHEVWSRLELDLGHCPQFGIDDRIEFANHGQKEKV